MIKLLKFIKEFWGVILGAIITVALAVWYFVIRKKPSETEEKENVETDADAFNKAGIKPSYAQSWYDDTAKQIFEKFRVYRFITKAAEIDMKLIINKLYNYQDFLQLKKSFGIRTDMGSDMTLSEFVVKRFDYKAQALYNAYVRVLLEKAKKAGVKFSA